MAKLQTKTYEFDCDYAVTISTPPRLYLVVYTDIDTAKYVFSDPMETDYMQLDEQFGGTDFEGYTVLISATPQERGIRISLAKE